MMRILFLCTGNTCRSPMAAALLRQALNKELGERAAYIEIESAGLGAVPASLASSQAREVMREQGLDLNDHRARQLTPKIIRSADIILTMTRYQKEQVLSMEPSARDRVWSLGELASLAAKDTTLDQDVADPFGQGEETYRKVRRQLQIFMEPVVEHIKKIDSTGK